MATKNIHIVEEAGSGPFMDAYFDNLEGSGGSSYVLPAATISTLGGVKKASAVSDVATEDASNAADDTPTSVEFQDVVNLCNENKQKLNALLSALRTAGIIENS